jgi:PAS domain S-box-containing protein
VRQPRQGRLMWLSMREAPGRTTKGPYLSGFTYHLPQFAILLGMIAALVGVGHLIAWLGGYLTQRGLNTITMKTNTALCLTLAGVALMLLAPAAVGSARRWTARICVALVLLMGGLTLVENVSGWDFGIDQLLAVETPGAMGMVSPNRMGTPASLCFILIGLALWLLSRRDHRGVRVIQPLAVAVCLIALLATLGFLYNAQNLYGIAQYTTIAWPTAVALLLLGLGLLCARPAEGLMAQVMANDPGGISLRRLLPVLVILSMLLAWVHILGERAGIWDPPMAAALTALVFIVVCSALAYHAARRTSRSTKVMCESQKRLERSQEIAHLGSWELDLISDRLTWSDEVYRIFGLQPWEFGATYEAFLDCVHPQDRAAVDAAYSGSLREGRDTYEIEHRVVRKSTGEIRLVHEKCEHIRDASGRIVRSIGMVHDITERKQAQEALRVSEEKFRTLHALSPIAIVLNRLDNGQFLESNQALWDMTGYTEEEFRSLTYWDITPIDYQDMEAKQLELLHTVGRYGPYEKEYIRKDGRRFPVLLSGVRIKDPSGTDLIYSVIQDITELKAKEQALRELNATLEDKVAQRTAELRYRARQLQKLALELSQAEERERRRIAVILHEDLQQQIAGARFHVNLLKDQGPDDRQRAQVDRVDEMLREVIEKSRSLSRDLSPTVLHMDDLAEALQWLVHRVREQQGLKVQLHSSGDLTLHSEALAMFLFRAAQEMLFNVVKHARVREAALRARRIGRCVCLAVSDRGRGFDPRELRETAGIGLFSIRERIELLGGRMTIKSAKGQGSRFRILVPDGPHVGRKGRTSEGEKVRGSPSPSPLLTFAPSSLPGPVPLRILLVDDHDIVREGLAALLQEAPDIEVVGEAANGREAVEMTGASHPDVVIMDVSMPLMSGEEATRLIKAYFPQTRVIALSMYDEAEKKEKMFEAGAEDYILKTVSADDLLAAIRGKSSDL